MKLFKTTQLALLAAAVAISGSAVAQGASDKSSSKSAQSGAAKSDAKSETKADGKADAKAGAKSDGKKGEAGSLSSQDRNFVMKAAQAGHAEVETGKLAAAQAADPGIKQFGEKMVQDHGKANDELAQIAKSKGVEPPTAPDQAHQKLAKRLQGLKGAEFDRVYLREVGHKDHDDAIKLFQSQAKSGRDPELKAFAEKTLPTLQEHRRMAGELSSKGKSAKK